MKEKINEKMFFKFCAHCGILFYRRRQPDGKIERPGKWAGRIFCSVDCSNHSRDKRYKPKNCQFCGEQFKRKENETKQAFKNRKYCEDLCYSLAMKRARKEKYKKNTFYGTKSELRFINNLPSDKILGYLAGAKLRHFWGDIDKSEVIRAAEKRIGV